MFNKKYVFLDGGDLLIEGESNTILPISPIYNNAKYRPIPFLHVEK
ncbi:MAG: hypothetical protein ABIK28_10075 [Planctomycetota bacterium]